MALDWSNEEYTGSDATGTDGQANRILTLANSGLTNNNGFLIKVGGLYLKRGSEFTLTHNTIGTTVTFLNPLWDALEIEAKFYVRTWGDQLVNWKIQNSSGSDCSGSSGESNRILTLENTNVTTNAGLFVAVSGLKLTLDTDYTISNLSSSSTITFLNPLWENMTIVAKYYEKPDNYTKEYSKVRDDLQEIVIEHGITAYLKRPTETVDSMGGVSAVELAGYNIFVSIQDITNKDRQIISMGLANPGSAKAFFFDSYPDSVTSNGDLTVQTGDVIVDGFDREWRLEKILGKKTFQGEIIFISAILNRIDLD